MLTLGPGNLQTTQTASHTNLDAIGAKAHCILYYPLHRTSEVNTAFQLLGDVLCNQIGIQFRLSDFFYVQVYRYAHHLGYFLTQSLNFLAFLPDNNTWPGRVDCNRGCLCRALDFDPADRSMGKPFLDELPYLQISMQHFHISVTLGIPDRSMVFHYAKTHTCRMYFLTHNSLRLNPGLLVRNR